MTNALAARSTTRRLATALLATVLTILLLAGAGAPAFAAEEGDQQAAGDWAQLEERVAQDGTVPVIVTLDAPATLPHKLDASKLRNQKAAIAKARNGLRRELATKNLRNLKTMDDLPLVAFTATAEDLAALKGSDHVTAVSLDEERELPRVASKGKTRSVQDVERTNPGLDEPVKTAGTTSNGMSNQLSNWWDYYRIGVNRAFNNGYRGAGQVVAVLDTGVDRYHNWLRGDVVAEACFATNNARNGGTCPNGRWYQYGTGAAAPCRQSGCEHGTHVAHTAAGYHGVASGARIIAVQVFHPTPRGLSAWDSDITWGLKYVYDLRTSFRIAAVNMSLGGGGYSGYCDSNFSSTSAPGKVLSWMKALAVVGIPTVVASGNDNYSRYVSQPACFSTAISVGNTTLTSRGADAVFGNARYIGTDGKTYWTGSNSNATLDLLAPGTDICSAVPNNGVNCWMSGTSMAAPHVAGAMALLREYRPNASIQQMVAALHRSGTSVYDGRNGVTRTRINVWFALGMIYKV